ncbi:MAG: sulfatase-like hydrolase/transferase [Chitinophagaceae bacterium]
MPPKQLKIFPFSILLLPIFFVWHVANEYFGLIPFSYSARFLFYYFILAIVLFFIGKLLFRNNIKSGCWTTILLIIFFFWGAAHDTLRSLHLPAFLSSYKFLFSTALIIVILLTVLLRKKNAPGKLHRFFTVLFLIFILSEAIISISKFSNKQLLKNDLAYTHNSIPAKLNAIDAGKQPDIFLIIFDEYASSSSLQQYIGYNNSVLDSSFLKNGFYIATGSKSNYNSTPLSIASFLDMQYFDKSLEEVVTKPKLVLQGQYTIRKSIVPSMLERQGYKVLNLGLCDLDNHPAPTESFFNNNAIEALYLETLWGRIQKEIWWNVQQKTSINWTFLQSSRRVNMPETNLDNLHKMLAELNTETNTPRFVITHVMMPHKPFFFDKHGNRRGNPYANDPAIDDSLYTDQLIYTNTFIDSICQTTRQQHQRPRVIVIAGDHGYRDKENTGTRDKQFMNLNAWYFSDGDYSTLYKSISPVNSFRIILNKYFSTGLPLLKDSTIRLIE